MEIKEFEIYFKFDFHHYLFISVMFILKLNRANMNVPYFTVHLDARILR